MVRNPPATVNLIADLLVERVEAGRSVGSVAVSNDADGSIRLVSSGDLPRIRLRQLPRLRRWLNHFSQRCSQTITVVHDDAEILCLMPRAGRNPKWTIRWAALARLLLPS